jgi:hypothetical protein
MVSFTIVTACLLTIRQLSGSNQSTNHIARVLQRFDNTANEAIPEIMGVGGIPLRVGARDSGEGPPLDQPNSEVARRDVNKQRSRDRSARP